MLSLEEVWKKGEPSVPRHTGYTITVDKNLARGVVARMI
jgi:hypothetical protein